MINSLAELKTLDVEKIAQAIEADAGMPLADLRTSLQQAKEGQFAVVHKPDELRRRGRPRGTVAEARKAITAFRLDADVLSGLRASGKGWQTRVNTLLREAVEQGRI